MSEGAGARGAPRILMVSANAYPVMGGVETHLNEVAPRIGRDGFDVTVLTSDRGGRLPRSEEMDGVRIQRVRAWPEKRDYYLAPGIYGGIKNGDWDLVHCHGYQTFVPPLALFAAVRARLPFVITFHSGGHGSALRTRLRGTQQSAMRPLIARAKRLIAVSDFEVEYYSSHLNIPRKRFVTIPNGADMAWPTEPVPIDDAAPVILSVGRLERYKGHHRFIEALPQIVAAVPGARLRILGRGPYEDDLRRMAAESPLAERISIGSVDPTDREAMAKALAGASLVTLLSEFEANPVAVMEALALRRRVLVADTSGMSELARRGLARAIPVSATNDEIAAAVAEQLRGPEPAEFSLPTWDDCAARVAQVYREVLAS